MLNRRSFVSLAAVFATGGAAAIGASSDAPVGDEDVSPPEDLMREHGALNRILLIYDRAHSEISRGNKFPLDVLHSAANTIQSFIESYHEKLEEDYLFPRFEKAGKHVDLVHILLSQHQAGRLITADILGLAQEKSLTAKQKEKLLARLESFVRMYRPHEAREDTVLFPAFRDIASKTEFEALGEKFEKKEHELFGADGFEGVVARIAELEQRVGIYDLAQFTPKTD
jgi:hemerythrin-like domain-containing protein